MRAIKDHEAFLLPGGRLEILENSQGVIGREMQEELGIALDYKLISIEENIVKDTKFHMIEFVFYGEIDSFETKREDIIYMYILLEKMDYSLLYEHI